MTGWDLRAFPRRRPRATLTGMRLLGVVAVALAVLAGTARARVERATLAHRRAALAGDLGHLLSVVPPFSSLVIADADKERLGTEGLSQLQSQYETARGEAEAMKKDALRPMKRAALETDEARFPALESELLSLLFSATSSRYFGDKDRFLQAKQKELAIRVVDERKERGTRRQAAAAQSFEKQLGSVPDAGTLDSLYDAAHARMVVSQLAVAAGRGPRQALGGVPVSEFEPTIPHAASYLDVPPATIAPASAPQQASFAGGILAWLDQTRAAQLARYMAARATGFGGRCLASVANGWFHLKLMTESLYDDIIPARRVGNHYTHFAGDVGSALSDYLDKHDGPTGQAKLRQVSAGDLEGWLKQKTLPLGATIVYEQGACGFSRRYGHIEVVTSQVPLRATSDGVEGVDLSCVAGGLRSGRVSVFLPAKVP